VVDKDIVSAIVKGFLFETVDISAVFKASQTQAV
jgi:hypothetical protein